MGTRGPLARGRQELIGDERCVIRIPPPHAPPDRDAGILREWRIIHALHGSEVPHTAAVAVRDDPTVLGRPTVQSFGAMVARAMKEAAELAETTDYGA